ncbi:uncharacterized protein LOC18425873 [Amborella trichopoda]|uniref:uncharacterized protein LOC18425873 n=1 Tax=Amborella trichopoda TaxID=13333 RepID=UPI0005D3EC4F|nr:uncharacterized protein LOC18425873 [Amborella trichopoda]|eukprot:XP_011620325.1 uncharacterized protein LOC18425873 [Amborella trichopoda]
MESIIGKALEYTLKYWLKSFSREQFKLQGRTAQLYNLDINGDALHASAGLPPALNVTHARVGKLEIQLPSFSNVQTEPIVVQIDKLDLVLEENTGSDLGKTSCSNQSSSSSAKSSGYGFADKIADGMTVEVGIVNLMLETRGGPGRKGGATWTPPLASITIRNLLLYTTNEKWQVVNLKEARDFSDNEKFIYVFKKMEWESLSIDLLPHPDMFADERLTSSNSRDTSRDDDGAKRLFFGGERFLDSISGQAYITVQRTEQNNPLGLEVQLHIPEAVCPSLSEPGLRALLRFMTGLYVCLNRGDVDPKAQQRCTEAAGRSLVSIIVDHVFLCVKDAEFQLELLMQSLYYSRASVSDGENTKNISRVIVGGLFLRDTFSHPPCTLVQPSMQIDSKDSPDTPDFAGEGLWPKIYPLGEQPWQLHASIPLVFLYSFQLNPSPAPPSFASQTVINCEPLIINLQEKSCLRISSFLADGIVVNSGAVLPDFSVNSMVFTLKEFNLTVPLDSGLPDAKLNMMPSQSSFEGARLHAENLIFHQSPALRLKLLNLEKDPACFCLWESQPIDSSQRKWTMRASHLNLSLETSIGEKKSPDLSEWSTGLWRCVELQDACFEAAMVTADGSPLITVPPPGGLVRIGVACEQYLSNTSVEQLLFVLDLYAYFGRVSEEIAKVGKIKRQGRKAGLLKGGMMDYAPSDTGVSLALNHLRFRFLESSASIADLGMPLVQFEGEDLFIGVTHRTLGGAVVVSSSIHWELVQVDCVDSEGLSSHEVSFMTAHENGRSQMRPVFWIDNRRSRVEQNKHPEALPFLEVNTVHVMPYRIADPECHSLSVVAKVSGVRLGCGMNYTEALLHRFGILGPDGGPSEGLSNGLKNLSSGPLSKLLRASPHVDVDHTDNGISEDIGSNMFLEVGRPDDLDVSIEFRNWLFALEGAKEMAGSFNSEFEQIGREKRCWHTTFRSLEIKAKSSSKHSREIISDEVNTSFRYPVELIIASVEGLQAIKPQARNSILQSGHCFNGTDAYNEELGLSKQPTGGCSGIDLETRMVLSEDVTGLQMAKWEVESLKFSVKHPIEAVATKDELEHLVLLCRLEVDSMGRIAAGILRVLKLEESIGQATINQRSESLDRIFAPEKVSRCSSVGKIGFMPSSNTMIENMNGSLDSTIACLEAAISDSQALCVALDSNLLEDPSIRGPKVTPQYTMNVGELTQKLGSMQMLLSRLRTQI